jgi:hypothetical protein
MAVTGHTEERLVQAAQVNAGGGQKKVEARARILDVKDQLRDARRQARLRDKGY